jgi:hypothetical protein
MPDVWGPELVPFLRIANWMVMVVEPFMVLPLFLRPGHPLKAVGGVMFTGFHIFILTTLGLPFAMSGLLMTSMIFFGPELTAAASRWSGAHAPPTPGVQPRLTRPGRFAVAFLVVLFLATTRRVPAIGALNVPAYGVLWMMGVAQDYRLFNWIDRVNFDVETSVMELGASGTGVRPAAARYPSSFRSKLLLAYLHDIRWLRLPRADRPRMRASIATRLAGWYCRNNQPERPVLIASEIYRLVPTGREHESSLVVAEFDCRGGSAILHRVVQPVLVPGDYR